MTDRLFGVVSSKVEPVSGTSVVPGARWAPAGTVHAVRGRGTLTVCGSSAAGFYPFPGHDFAQLADLERCPVCVKELGF
jgi:hypothetical protein